MSTLDMTEREQDVLNSLSEALSNQEIADQLCLSVSTVKWYVRRLNAKLGTSNRDEIISRSRELGLLDYEDYSNNEGHYHFPKQLSVFVGREAEIDEIKAIIESPNVRLLTILAPGGMGKTRIALEVAQQQIDNFEDGVYFVGLEALKHPDYIIPTIAQNIGFQFFNGRDRKTQLLEYFASKHLLLLIDNWEHLLGGIAIISDILLAAPHVKILATSREKLNLSCETVYQLGGMLFPEEQDVSNLSPYDAVELCVRSAQRIKPDFALDEDTVYGIIRVCQLTGGMPLAILLAVTWLDMLPLSELVTELEQGLELFQSGMHDIQKRHRNIQMIFERSWRQLSENEQQVLMQLSIFHGSFARKAARIVADTNLLTLRALIDKAMIQVKDGDRYDVHELLRQFSSQKLNELSDADSARERHSDYYLNKLGELWIDLKGARQLGALDEIQVDYENFRDAWQWAVVHRRYDLLDVSMDALTFFHDVSSQNHEHMDLFDFAIEELAPTTNEEPHLVWGKLLTRRWALLQWCVPKDLSPPRNDLDLSMNIARQNNNLFESALSGLFRGQLEHHCENYAKSLEYFQESLEIFRKIGDTYYISWGLHRVAFAFYFSGKLDKTIKLTHQAISLAKINGDIVRASVCYANIGGAYMMNNEARQALEMIEIALELNRKVRRNQMYWLAVGLKSYWHFCVGQFEDAISLAESSRKEMLKHNLPDFSYCDATLVLDACIKGDYERAYRLVQNMQDYFILKIGDFVTCWVSCIVACGRGAYIEARQLFAQHIHDPTIVGKGSIAEILPITALILTHEGSYQWAVELLSLEASLDYAITEWMRHWPLVKDLYHDLRQKLGDAMFESAWEHGIMLDLQTTFEAIKTEFYLTLN